MPSGPMGACFVGAVAEKENNKKISLEYWFHLLCKLHQGIIRLYVPVSVCMHACIISATSLFGIV